jgi:hypothetical protein
MDRQIEHANAESPENAALPARSNKSYTSGHLMCRTPLWGIACFLGCSYFAWISFGHVSSNEYDWPHDLWTAATYIVWILLLTGLTLQTRCLRERVFFGVLLVNFVIGCALTLWYYAPPSDVRIARIGTGALWAVAALLSLTTLSGPSKSPEKRT